MKKITRWSLLLASALLTALLWGDATSPTAKTQSADLTAAMRQARERNDWQTYLSDAAKVQQLLNGSPNTWLNFARGEMHAGHLDKALGALEHFVATGQSADLLLTSPEFEPLRSNPKFAAIREKMAANDSPVSHATPVFDVAEAGFVAEDIDYDPRSRRFFVSSIQKHKIIAIDMQGKATDFVSSPNDWPMMAVKLDSQRHVLWATEVALKDFASVAKEDWGRSRLLCFSLENGNLLRHYEGPANSALGDMVLLDNGDPLLPDGQGGGVYRFVRGMHTFERVDDGSYLSPQTPTLAPDKKRVFVPDYLRGIGILDLASKKTRWIPMEAKYALNGTDGLYFYQGSLILTQNGTSPERVIAFKLNRSLSHVASGEVIERATKTLGDPTHGVIVDQNFYYIANSGWDTLNDDGTVKPDAKATPVHIMRARLQ